MPLIPAPVLLNSKVKEFLTYCEARNLSPNSLRAYRADLNEFIDLSGGSETVSNQGQPQADPQLRGSPLRKRHQVDLGPQKARHGEELLQVARRRGLA